MNTLSTIRLTGTASEPLSTTQAVAAARVHLPHDMQHDYPVAVAEIILPDASDTCPVWIWAVTFSKRGPK